MEKGCIFSVHPFFVAYWIMRLCFAEARTHEPCVSA